MRSAAVVGWPDGRVLSTCERCGAQGFRNEVYPRHHLKGWNKRHPQDKVAPQLRLCDGCEEKVAELRECQRLVGVLQQEIRRLDVIDDR